MPEGGEASVGAQWPSPARERQNYEEAATLLAASGADFLFLEMMKDFEHGPRAIEAAGKCGLPVFLGISTRHCPERGLVWYGTGRGSDPKKAVPFDTKTLQWMLALTGDNLVCVNVMHTNFDCVVPTLQILRKVWNGHVGVYPDHGRFVMPNWEFEELTDAQSREYVQEWLSGEKADLRVGMIGGCCGLGPEFMTVAAEVVKEENENEGRRKKRAAAHRMAMN